MFSATPHLGNLGGLYIPLEFLSEATVGGDLLGSSEDPLTKKMEAGEERFLFVLCIIGV